MILPVGGRFHRRALQGPSEMPEQVGDDSDGWRQSAATLRRIYPYRAAKQQAPGVAADDGKGFPNRSGMTGRGTIRPPVAVSVFMRLVRN